ncbi:hypothetical protein U3516DRAFT_814236, partial [Neocallimastix sp. 'constans']
MFKKLLTTFLIATVCITYVCGIKLVGPAIYSDISHLYFLNSRDCKITYICKGYCIIKNSNQIPVGAYLKDTQYKNPDKCKCITRHISTINRCYYTPNNTRGGFSWRGYVNHDARVYDIVVKYCLTEYCWCWRS